MKHWLAALVSLLALARGGVAHASAPVACGGCFAPPETVTTVDAHRMVVSLSPQRTILWDQIRYSGAPEDFVWVLPVPNPNVKIDVADEQFFAELEAQTAPQIQPLAAPPCPGTGGGSFQDAGAGGGVDVYQERVVGPYQTVVVGAEESEGLVDWLTTNGYAIPDSTLPAIDHYVDRDQVFVVLRLAPDEDVNAMQPVRVEFKGYMGTFPLQMVTVGAYGSVALTLWVIAEQRYTTSNYGSVTIDPDDVEWLGSASNYRELFGEAIDEQGGSGWVTQYAGALDRLWFSNPEELDDVREDIPYPYVTRLATDIRVENITGDLELAPDEDPSSVSNLFTVQAPSPTCPGDGGSGGERLAGCSLSAPMTGFGGLMGCLLAVGLLRRRRR